MGKLAFTTQIVSERAFITKSKMAGGARKTIYGMHRDPQLYLRADVVQRWEH